MGQTAALIADHLDEWGYAPLVVRDVFEDPQPEQIAATLDEFCLHSLGSSIERSEFFRASVGSVHGVRLADGRRVVVKVHRGDASITFLQAMQTVQRALVAADFPCPEPLVGPTPLGRGLAVGESLIDRGEPADAHLPDIRRAMAQALWRLAERCRGLTSLDGLRQGPMAREQGQLWPRPHDSRFDFQATSPGAEWIDAIACEGRRVLEDSARGEWVVSHGDWRAGNMRFKEGEASAVYDWDSLRIEREPALVGSVAHMFTADWGRPQRRQLPTLAEALAFAADYEAARPRSFTSEERRVLRAALTYAMAYTARCEHSDLLSDFGRHAPAPPDRRSVPAHSARAFLAAHAAELLGAPVGATPAIAPALSH